MGDREVDAGQDVTPSSQDRQRVLGICGSLRAKSSNRAALEALAVLAGPSFDVAIYHRLREIPPFDPDEEPAPPPVVRELRALAGSSAWMVISSPEYAHGIAGSLKNLLDWLVGSETFAGISVAIINASPRSHHADDQLREVLKTMSAAIIDEACVDLPLMGRNLDVQGILADQALCSALRICVGRIANGANDRGPLA